jgi:hypothetical protein
MIHTDITIAETLNTLTKERREQIISNSASIVDKESFNNLLTNEQEVLFLLAFIFNQITNNSFSLHKFKFEFFDGCYTIDLPIEINQQITPCCNHISNLIFFNSDYYLLVKGKQELNNLRFQASFYLSKSQSIELAN